MLKTKNIGIITKCDAETAFAKIPNEVCQDMTLTLISKGILIYLLSLPPDWSIVKTDMNRLFGVGRFLFDKGWKQLVNLGYIVPEKHFNPKDKTNFYTYKIYSTTLNQRMSKIQTPDHNDSDRLSTHRLTDARSTDSQTVNKEITQKNINKEITNVIKEHVKEIEILDKLTIEKCRAIHNSITKNVKYPTKEMIDKFVNMYSTEELSLYKRYILSNVDFIGIKDKLLIKLEHIN